MKDKKLIEALEWCGFDEELCVDCPISESCEKNIDEIAEIVKTIRDLIEKRQDEIEMLNHEVKTLKAFKQIDDEEWEIKSVALVANARKEAIKEFAAKLKQQVQTLTDPHDFYGITYISPEAIDNLVKEMIGKKMNHEKM